MGDIIDFKIKIKQRIAGDLTAAGRRIEEVGRLVGDDPTAMRLRVSRAIELLKEVDEMSVQVPTSVTLPEGLTADQVEAVKAAMEQVCRQAVLAACNKAMQKFQEALPEICTSMLKHTSGLPPHD